MVNVTKNLYKDYEKLVIRNDFLEDSNRDILYKNRLLLKQIETLEKNNQNKDLEIKNKDVVIKEKDEVIVSQEREIQRLKSLLGVDGTNSGIPTSQTPINRKKVIPNTRVKTGKKRGGQKGHQKHKLNHFSDEEINEVVEHTMDKCPCCNSRKINKLDKTIDKDELDFKIIVIKRRHKFNKYKCEECGNTFHEIIPNNLKEENQYGSQIQAFELTLMNQANVTMNKAKSITYGITDGQIDLSEGYIAKLQKRASNGLKSFKEELRNEILIQRKLHWDDTVIMINTKRACLRFYGTKKLALYYAHAHKNKEGLDEDNILNLLSKEAVVVHDHNIINYNDNYGFTNAECNRHLLADIKKIKDNLGHEWCNELTELLCTANKKREEMIKAEKEKFSQEYLNDFNNKFDNIMLKAFEENEKDKNNYNSDKEHTLILRILDYKEQYLLWLYDFDVPFTNNLSERSLRCVKSKMKSSGQFWNDESAGWYADIRSYIETCNRNGVNQYIALSKLVGGKPFTLKEILGHDADL